MGLALYMDSFLKTPICYESPPCGNMPVASLPAWSTPINSEPALVNLSKIWS